MKETLAIDIDDVINPSLASFIAFQNEKYGTDLTLDHFMHHDDYWGYYERALGRAAGIGAAECLDRYEQFKESVEPDSQIVSDEVRIGLNGLKRWFDLQIITARDYSSRDRTVEWVEAQLPDVFSDIHFNRTPEAEVPKVEICRKIGAVCLIDDAPEHVNAAAEAGVRSILFGQYGWNMRHEVHPTVVRIPTWQETFAFLEKSAKKA